MSKSIWHRYDEAPKHQDIIMTDTGCWAYRADLLSLETENKGISDKIVKLETDLERTRKTLDIAKNAINSAVDHNIINCMARGIDPRTDDTSVTLCNALEQIIALEQKDK